MIKFIKCITVKKNIYINVRSETRVIAFQLKNATKKQPLAGATRLPTDAGWRAAPSTGKWWRHSSASWRHFCPAMWNGRGPWRCGPASSFGCSPPFFTIPSTTCKNILCLLYFTYLINKGVRSQQVFNHWRHFECNF